MYDQFFTQLNSAFVKSKENGLNEFNVQSLSSDPTITALEKSVVHLQEKLQIEKEEAILRMIQVVRQLNKNWQDYISMEGINKLKAIIKDDTIDK